jgi:hypothetical protein
VTITVMWYISIQLGPYFGSVMEKSVGYLPMAKPATIANWGSVTIWFSLLRARPVVNSPLLGP